MATNLQNTKKTSKSYCPLLKIFLKNKKIPLKEAATRGAMYNS